MFVLGKHDPIPRVDGQWQRRLINVNAMAEAGFWVAWGHPTQGREKQALDLLNETRGYLERLAQDRRVGGGDNAEPGERRHLLTDDASRSPSTTGTSRRCRRVRATVTAVSVVALLLSAPALAWADPEAPQPGTACSVDMSDVMTWPSDARMPLVCANGQWQTVTSPQPPNDRWLSYGPAMTLHGQGMRNPSVESGNWTATPQDPGSQCRAEQETVVSPGVLSQPQVSEGKPGQPLSLQLLPRLFSIQMSGYCLWTRTAS